MSMVEGSPTFALAIFVIATLTFNSTDSNATNAPLTGRVDAC